MTLKKQKQEIQKNKEIKLLYDKNKNKYGILDTTKKGVILSDRIITTDEIMKSVDIGSKERVYKLSMDNGPYTVRYSISGDTVMYIGQEEVKSINTIGLTVNTERMLNDKVYDGTFLHSGSFYALAQSKAVYVYDKMGVELHVIREARGVRSLKFLQDHFLLATVSDNGYLRYQDTTIGKCVSEIKTKERDSTLEVDRTNGVVYLTGQSGTVSLWSPRSSEYLSKVLCHRSKVRHCKVSDDGCMLYTGSKNEVKTWDIRNMFKPIKEISLPGLIREMSISQMGKLAVSQRSGVIVYNKHLHPEVQHSIGRDLAHSLTFMPYEDILTIGSTSGVENIIIPGSGRTIYRRNENPNLSRKEKRNSEVRRILEKIPADLISLENDVGSEAKDLFEEEIVPMKYETPAGKVRRLMKLNYG
ncbi:U3 small nucleolar RNA-associated protein 7 [Nematocida sp. ERTm5]|nr:U3 small nucleolar RNA-associated protein 7 [Nematocida sp. ERTm5]